MAERRDRQEILSGLSMSPNWIKELEKARRGKGIGREIIYLAETVSTNREAWDRALQGAGEGLVVLADSQSQGRGRMGRSWSSPPGKNLYFSIVLRPALSPQQTPQITLLAGISCAQALIRVAGMDARIKWPNDIFIRGKKTCGILAEMEGGPSRAHFVVLGIGVNVNWAAEDMPSELRETATSLLAETGREFDRAAIAATILDELERGYALFLREGFSPRMREEWNRLSWVNGKRGTLSFGEQRISGQILGLDTDGALLLIDPEGKTRRFLAGDVSLRI